MKISYLSVLSLALLPLFGHANVTTTVSPSTAPLPKLDSLKDEKPLKFTIPKMERFTTDNGVPVIFTSVTELPIVDISLTFKGGSAKDSEIRAGGYGIAEMTATMMTQGTANMDENEFAEAAELLGVSFGATAWRDTFTYTFRSLSDDEQLTPALGLFADMIQNPRFDTNILKRNQAQYAVGFAQKKSDPAYIAQSAFFKAIYGDHPYAERTEGNETSVATISRDDLIAYKNKYLVSGNAHISITGDLSLDEAKTIANRLSATLPKGNKASDLPTPKTPKPTHIHVPYDSTQTHILIGHLGEKDSTDPAILQERTNFSLGNSVLAGGDFNARLMKEIRDKGGYTYGITGGMAIYDEKGYYQIKFSTQTERAKEAIGKTLDVVNDTLKAGISSDELELERTSRKYAYPTSLATNQAIHSTATQLNYDGLPDSHITDALTRLEMATLTDVNATLNRYVRPDEFIIVTLGKEKPNLDQFTPKKSDKQTKKPVKKAK